MFLETYLVFSLPLQNTVFYCSKFLWRRPVDLTSAVTPEVDTGLGQLLDLLVPGRKTIDSG
jgi:hypothetical protein